MLVSRIVVEPAQREAIGHPPRAFKLDTGDRRAFDGVGRPGGCAAKRISRDFRFGLEAAGDYPVTVEVLVENRRGQLHRSVEVEPLRADFVVGHLLGFEEEGRLQSGSSSPCDPPGR